jgi:hypothetical protein
VTCTLCCALSIICNPLHHVYSNSWVLDVPHWDRWIFSNFVRTKIFISLYLHNGVGFHVQVVDRKVCWRQRVELASTSRVIWKFKDHWDALGDNKGLTEMVFMVCHVASIVMWKPFLVAIQWFQDNQCGIVWTTLNCMFSVDS